MVLGQAAGEEHAVPVFIGARADQMRHGAAGERVAKLAAAGAQMGAQLALLLVHVIVGFGLVHGQRFQRDPGTLFGDLARLDHGVFQLSALFRSNGWHGVAFSFP